MKNVVIYTSTSCMFCHKAKAFFDKNNIIYFVSCNINDAPSEDINIAAIKMIIIE